MVMDGIRDSELTVKKGDTIVVFDATRSDLWFGLLNQKKGFFPPWVISGIPSQCHHESSSDAAGASQVTGSDLKQCRQQHAGSQTTEVQTLRQLAQQAETDTVGNDEGKAQSGCGTETPVEIDVSITTSQSGSGCTPEQTNQQHPSRLDMPERTTLPGGLPNGALVELGTGSMTLPDVTNCTSGASGPSTNTNPSQRSSPSLVGSSVNAQPRDSGNNPKTSEKGPCKLDDRKSCAAEDTPSVSDGNTTRDSGKHSERNASKGNEPLPKATSSSGSQSDSRHVVNTNVAIENTTRSDVNKRDGDSSTPLSEANHSQASSSSSSSLGKEDRSRSSIASKGGKGANNSGKRPIASKVKLEASGSCSVEKTGSPGSGTTAPGSCKKPGEDKSKMRKPPNGEKETSILPDSSKLEQDTSKNETKEEEKEVSSRPPTGPGVIVEFHVVIHEEWKVPMKQSPGSPTVHIQFGESELGDWKWNCVNMQPTESVGSTKHIHLVGECLIPVHITRHIIAYKYVVVSRKSKTATEYEYIIDASYGGVVNRALDLPEDLRGKARGFHRKFDDVMRRRPAHGIMHGIRRSFRSVVSIFVGSEYVHNRILALEAMLPKWPGFCGSAKASEGLKKTTAGDALNQLLFVVKSLEYILLWESNRPVSTCRPYQPAGFDQQVIKKEIQTFVNPQLQSFGQSSKSATDVSLPSAVALCVLVHVYSLDIDIYQLAGLLKSLAIQPDGGADHFSDYDLLAAQFHNMTTAAKGVEHVIKMACQRNHERPAEWLLALPALHFMQRNANQLRNVESEDVKSPHWWGLTNIKEEVKEFRRRQTAERSPMSLAEDLKPLCSADPLLSRAFLYALTLFELPRAIEIGIGRPSEFVRAVDDKLYDLTTIPQETTDMLDGLLRKLLAHVKGTAAEMDAVVASTENKSGVIASVQLLQAIAARWKSKSSFPLLQRTKTLAFGFMVQMTMASELLAEERARELKENGNRDHESHQDCDAFLESQLEQGFRSLSEWMGVTCASHLNNVKSLGDELKVWNDLLEAASLPEKLKQEWQTLVKKKLIGRIDQVKESILVQAYCQYSDSGLHPVIVSCFQDISERHVDRLVKDEGGQHQTVSSLLTSVMSVSKGRDHSAKLLRLFLIKSCPKSSASTPSGWVDWCHHLLRWQHWKTLLRLTGENRAALSLLQEGGELVLQAASILVDISDRLCDSSITVAQLLYVRDNTRQFLDLCKLWDSLREGEQRHDRTEASLRARSAEIDRYNTERRHIENFVSFCAVVSDGVSEDWRGLSQSVRADVSREEMRMLCQQDDRNLGVLSCFPVSHLCCQFVRRIWDARDSDIFKRLWNERGREVRQQRHHTQPPNTQPLTVDEVIQLICSPVANQWQQLCVEVHAGSVSLERVSALFRRLTGVSGSLERELTCIEACLERRENTAWKQERQEQIEQYSKLRDKIGAARSLKKVVAVLKASHSFIEIEQICDQDSPEFQQQPIRMLTVELLSAGRFLGTITGEFIACLESFARAPNLVAWLRDEIKEWKELETFVELAGTKSSEEGDFETGKVISLHAACAGFAPLLFDVKSDICFQDLQRRCEAVFASCKSDKDLISKWVSTSSCLEEFKITRASLSSVEVSSFSQVEMINSRGVYRVGCLSTSRSGLTTDDCVNLVIVSQGENTAGSGKVYHLSDLLDLQSKLMLISGRGDQNRNDEVEAFVEVLDLVISLANVFIKISKAGHDKYLNWKREFRCRKGAGSRYRQTLNVDVRERELQQLRSELDGDVRTLTRALRMWRYQVESFRSQYYYLNYFTTPQLLILRQQLGKLVCDSHYRLPGEIFALLGSVDPNCSMSTVTRALSSACGSSVQRTSCSIDAQYLSKESLPFSALPVYSESDTRHIRDMGFSLDAAVAALRASNGDLNTAVTLCLEGGLTHDRADSGQDRAVALALSLSTEQEADAPVNAPRVDDPVVSDRTSYLSLDTLGRVLEQLVSSSQRMPERSFSPDQFRLGEPNLVVIPHTELLRGVLSLYIRDLQLPLPSAQEVLVCSSNTGLEEIILFWRRALRDPSHRRLFCLAMADSLSYEVSRKSWEKFNRLTQNHESLSTGSAYKLVIICAAENEDKSYLVDALDPYRRANVPLPSVTEVRSYLKQKFQRLGTSDFGLGIPPAPAASLDYEYSSVRVVRSYRAGDGKSFFIDHIAERLTNLPQNRFASSSVLGQINQPLHIVVPLHDQEVNTDTVLEILRPLSPSPDIPLARLVHIDVLPSASRHLDTFLFCLLILGEISNPEGYVWRNRPDDLYVVELTAPRQQDLQHRVGLAISMAGAQNLHPKVHNRVPFADFLPSICCSSPTAAQDFLARGTVPGAGDPDMADREFRNSNFQRAFQYLSRFKADVSLDPFKFSTRNVEGDHLTCLQTLVSNCGIRDPSWAEIKHFVNFLSSQLRDCENNDFCNPDAYGEDLPGFKAFVLKLMIRMSRDFATRSLDIQEGREPGQNELFELRRRWEHSPHPYLFFNEDRHSVTFVEVQVTRDGRLMDPRSGQVLEQIMSRELSTALHTQGFRLQENYNNWSKDRKLVELCRVMGIETVHDPDETYELTMDNVKKILAIQMRFRCGIPVILMGETGCGKTRLIRYMCALQSNFTGAKNMLLMKVHGGVTRRDIMKKVQEAEALAALNRSLRREYSVQTVLFFDEANTTDALGLIKEIMCDRRVNGRKIEGLGSSLQVIAACNPYRKHSERMIQRLEAAGLGYHVRAEETEDKLGHIPLRRLVYRVHALPDSMKALVWDFGQLDPNVEKLYVRQIVNRHVGIRQSIPNIPGLIDGITEVLAASQGFMRRQNDECSFVSLRDVERAMMVMIWFYKLHGRLEQSLLEKHQNSQDCIPAEIRLPPLSGLTRSLILAIGVCYQARLHDRSPFREAVVRHFSAPCIVPGGAEQIDREIRHCQQVFLDELELPPQIARNHALSENVFMMVVCIDLRIPLFLVGKPGSSKSLAKDVVKNAMKGQLSSSNLFQAIKQLHMVSYQCSPLSTAEGIIGAFQQCQRAQKERDKDRFVSCVVLDEVGLAEDSPRLPLKALHPLLDDGTAGADDADEEVARSNRVAFVGLSNWALDPAKMNRGILVNREVPDNNELIVSARGICSSDETIQNLISSLVDGMANAYKEIYVGQEREFFGLRDFYSLVKMIFSFCQFTGRPPTWNQLEHAVRRNFGGQDQENVVTVFRRCCPLASDDRGIAVEDKLDNSAVGLIRANLDKESLTSLGESRYLLLLTKNYAALNIIRQRILATEDPVIIFGSSFPKDQEYTQVCRTINRIKVCMATGRTVVLLNLEQLYESLYDALNQYYVYHGGQRFVDLGLGNHRVKCQVHKDFRLILVAERDVVYKDFPIPLINRMEKHFLAMESVLSPEQQVFVERLDEWAKKFAAVNPDQHLLRRGGHRPATFSLGDAFIGHNQDAAATLVLQAFRNEAALTGDGESSLAEGDEWKARLFGVAVCSLLACATPDAVARLHVSSLSPQARDLWDIYFYQQNHSSLLDYLRANIRGAGSRDHLLLQVTTHSRLLSALGVSEIRSGIGIGLESVALQQFDTEQQFAKRLEEFYGPQQRQDSALLVQCEAGDMNSELVACARYLVLEKRESAVGRVSSRNDPVYRRHLAFVVQLPRVAGGCFVAFQGGVWAEVHIDELRPANQVFAPSITSLANRRISSLLGTATQPNQMNANIESAENQTEDVSLEHTRVDEPPVLNAEAVLRACIHGAVSRLDDMEESMDNASRRIHILLQLIPDDTRVYAVTCQPFYEQLRWQVIKLLQERDSRMETDAATRWVRNEALSHSSLQAGGTFRRALWLRVVNAVTPILSEIVAFIDRNFNLELISEAAAGVSSWLTVLWLDIFNSSLVSRHRYCFLSPVQSEVSQRVRVQSSGYHEHLYHAQFPFSHVVKLELDGMMQQARRMAVERHERLDVTLQRLFDGSELGAIVERAHLDGNASGDEIGRRYLHDFVHMVYHASSDEEDKVVQSTILCGLSELISVPRAIDESTNGFLSLQVTIPSVHAAFKQVQTRLFCFGEMARCHPGIIAQLQRQINGVGIGEVLADAMAAYVLLEGLSPDAALRDLPQRSRWLKQMQRTKPIVESWFVLPFYAGSIRNALCDICRKMWAVYCAVRLFVEHTQSLAHDPFVLGAASTLYQCMSCVDVDFTKADTVRIVQRFLNETSKEYATKLFGPNRDKCRICLCEWTGKDPIALPCKHVFCHNCLEGQLQRNRACPVCGRNVPENFQPPANELKLAGNYYRMFKRYSTAFFMELVSVHSFSVTATLPPEPDLVHMLMELVVQRTLPGPEGRTRPFSPFDEDSIDPRPVVRSFILQLLLKYSLPLTLEYVEIVFANARESVRRDRIGDLEDLGVIFVHCIEDALHQRAWRSTIEERTTTAVAELQEATNKLRELPATLSHLQGVAGARFGLTVTAQALGDLLVVEEQSMFETRERSDVPSSFVRRPVISAATRNLLATAKAVCSNIKEPQLGLFLMKQLVRSRGIDVISRLQEDYDLDVNWLVEVLHPDENDTVMADYFVVLEQPYIKLREAVAITVICNEVSYMQGVVKTVTGGDATAPLLLAIYREVTSRRALPIHRQISAPTIALIEDYCSQLSWLPTWAKTLASELCSNSQGRPLAQLQVSPGLRAQSRALAGLALHILVTVSSSDGAGLIRPLRLMLTQPRTLANSYFPTMPEDYYMEARGLVEGTRWYECKNGHPYLVLNCGEPATTLRCTDCGEQIGMNTTDRDARTHALTQTGHILGPACRRSQDATPERDLSPPACSLVRLLMHGVLVWTSCSQDQSVGGGLVDVVKTPIAQDRLPGFFWSHFELDTRLFAKAIGRSVEDAIVVCHQLLNRIMRSGDAAQGCIGDGRLTSTQERKAWEAAFSQKYVAPTFQEMQTKMTDWLRHVMNDCRLGNNTAVRCIYELEHPSGSSSAPRLWRYRVGVSIDHLTHTLEQNMNTVGPDHCRLLKEFLKQEPRLRALQYLPDIIKLQRLLLDKYDRRISHEEALTFRVGAFLNSIEDREEMLMFRRLIDSFNTAWLLVRESVLSHGRLRPKKKEHELSCVNKQTQLAFLLPRTVDEGICATGLVDYLINCTHNEFLGTYRRLCGHEWEPERVTMDVVTRAHLVAYDVERDLMPLVLAHCDYSLSVGEGTNITYNLTALERQIIDRFVSGKPHVEMKDYRVTFRKDVYNSSLFSRLKQRIPQEELPSLVQRQITSEFHDIIDVYSVLALLDIVVGFMVSAGGSSDVLLHHYIHKTLKIPPDSGLVSTRAQQHCQLKHVLALWRLLTVEKGRRLSLANQEPFEHVSTAYRETLEPEVCLDLVKAFRKLSIEAFLSELVEIIMLELKQWEETANMEQYELRLAMQELYGSVLPGLDHIPSQVQLRHVVHCWNIAVKFEADVASGR